MQKVPKIDSAEREVTENLLVDFAVSAEITVEEVYRVSWERFNTIESRELLINKLGFSISNSPVETSEQFASVIHKFIYDDLYTFAGEFRLKADPGDGNIYFGKQDAHKRAPQFEGDSPEKITHGVREAMNFIIANIDERPLMNAIRFYQKFVNVHPFYDGNGRIARLIANAYLSTHELTVKWSEFDSKSKFLKKLNWCHKSGSNEAFEILFSYINNYTVSFDELENPN